MSFEPEKVALRKESVDRNAVRRGAGGELVQVALRKESVDRNDKTKSPPSITPVALRKESVDRNIKLDVSYNIKETSLSARRAWIEIEISLMRPYAYLGRSPQGERG